MRSQDVKTIVQFSASAAAFLVAATTLTAQAQIADDVDLRPDLPADIVDAAALFEPDDTAWAPVGSYYFMAPRAYDDMRRHQQVTLHDFALHDGLLVDLELERFYSTALGAQFFIGTDAGDVPAPSPRLATFRGRIAGSPESWAVLGITPERVYGIVKVREGEEYWIAPPPPELAGMPHAIYDRYATADHFGPVDFRCETPPMAPAPPGGAPWPAAPIEPGRGGGPDGFQWRVVALGLDGDWEYGQMFLSINDSIDYMALLVAVVSALYERDMEVKITITYARVWTTSNDPYTRNNTEDQLEEMQDYWNDHMDHAARNTAHLLSGRVLGGGRAFEDSLCDSDAYGVNSVNGSFPYPVRTQHADNWDIVVLAHELGHNLGSPHTHCYDPPIDTCAGMGFDCPNPRSCPVGTIMSYCHTCPAGIANMDLRFHSRVVDEIRDFISDECPRIGRSPCHVDGGYSGSEEGTVSEPFNSVLEGMQYVIPGARVLIRPRAYNERFQGAIIMNRPMRLERWGGSGVVRIGGTP